MIFFILKKMNENIFNNEDYLNYILEKMNILTHSNLILFSTVNKIFKNVIDLIIDKKFKYEQTMLNKIKTKIMYNVDLFDIHFNVKSVEEFKKKNNYDSYKITPNFNDFNEIFYCDCPLCYNTEPCGRGGMDEFTYEEYKFIFLNFNYFNWWIIYDNYNIYDDRLIDEYLL